MSSMTNDSNPRGTDWWNKEIYTKPGETIFPEEDYQVASLPKTVLHLEIGRRLGLSDERIIWNGKLIDMSAVSDSQLLHHVSLKLAC